eukprot:PITA_35655
MHIEMGDDSRYKFISVGTIKFQREHVAPLTLKNVMHVPGLMKDLVSISMLENRGYDVIFSKVKAFFQYIVMGPVKNIGIRVQNLYKIEVEDCVNLSTKVETMFSRDNDELWHRVLGHLHHGAFKIFYKISTGRPKGTPQQKKDQTFTKFCEFRALVEKESPKKVKTLWSDNGCEHVSNEYKNFYAAEGIKSELTKPHNPQQNGVSKRKYNSVVGEARAMLHDQGLSLYIWVEVCNTVVYGQNCTPHQILEMKTPEEAYFRKRPHVGHFKIFGSSIYCHITKDAWKKLEPTT